MKRIKLINIKIKSIVLILACFAMTWGCDVMNLDEEPKSFIAPENYFKTPEQIESILAGTQRRLFRNWGGLYDHTTIFRHTDQEMGGDLVIPQNHGSAFYAAHYANIKDLNHAIKAIKAGNLEGRSATVIDLLMGQLKFLRAWNYFQLVRLWGPIPLLTEDTEDYFNHLPTRAPIADVYGLIVGDYQEAINKLPADWGAKVGRPSKDAAKGLLAKAYLTMATAPLLETSNYAKAASLAKEVMDAGKYYLVPDINQVFSMATEDGPEMMWSFNANASNPSTHPKIWSGIYGWGDHAADIYWVNNVYPDQPRKHAYLETYNREGVPWEQTKKWAMGIKKYLYDTWDNFNRGFTTINIPIIRYADVLLIFAEAENMSKGGPTQAAVDAVNKVIDRANGYVDNPNHPKVTTAMTKEAFDAAVIHERNLELCFEYDRWFDLVRKRILREKSRPEIQNNFKEHIYLWPLPESEIRLNSNMEQNQGYSTAD